MRTAFSLRPPFLYTIKVLHAGPELMPLFFIETPRPLAYAFCGCFEHGTPETIQDITASKKIEGLLR
jgi:hypothetical protein